jgi:hypothetical protein
MRTKLLTSIVMVGAILFSGCGETGVEPRMSEAEITQHILDRLEKNEGLSVSMFQTLNEYITGDSLLSLKGDAVSKADFIDAIARNTDDYFTEVVEGGIAELEISTIPTPFAGDAETALKGYASMDATTLVEAYSNFILSDIDEQAKGGNGGILVLSGGNASAAADQPTETIAFSYEKIKFLVSLAEIIVTDQTNSDDEMWTAVNVALADDDTSPVAIGLLLPAVQKIREAASVGDGAFGPSMNTWLDGPVTQAINGGLNRDIIRRINATVYLAGLHALITEGYSGESVDMASLSLLHARYRAALIVSSGVVWDGE